MALAKNAALNLEERYERAKDRLELAEKLNALVLASRRRLPRPNRSHVWGALQSEKLHVRLCYLAFRRRPPGPHRPRMAHHCLTNVLRLRFFVLQLRLRRFKATIDGEDGAEQVLVGSEKLNCGGHLLLSSWALCWQRHAR